MTRFVQIFQPPWQINFLSPELRLRLTRRSMKSIPCFSKTILIVASASLLAARLPAADTLPKLDLKPAYPNLKFTLPLAMVEAPDGTHREFVVEQDGRIWILPADRNGSDPKLFLDISDRTPHADMKKAYCPSRFTRSSKRMENFIFSIHTPPRRSTTSSPNGRFPKLTRDKADPATERILLTFTSPKLES